MGEEPPESMGTVPMFATSLLAAELRMFQEPTVSAGTLTVEIWTDVAGSPGLIVGTGSASVDRTGIAAAEGWVSFTVSTQRSPRPPAHQRWTPGESSAG